MIAALCSAVASLVSASTQLRPMTSWADQPYSASAARIEVGNRSGQIGRNHRLSHRSQELRLKVKPFPILL
jgi:hypothetical protein